MTWSNIQIANVVPDVLGKNAQKIIKSVLDDPSQMPDIETLVHKSMIKKVDWLKLSIEDKIIYEQDEKIRVRKVRYDSIILCKNNLEQLIKDLAQEYQFEIELLQTALGVRKELKAIRFISEIRIDMT